jgi:uncharacterized cupin superfamily protein
VNLMTLPPGGWSSQRHWHSDEDEFVYLLEGELTLIENDGETVYLEVGSRNPQDLKSSSTDGRFVHKDGTPYPGR